MTYTTSKKKIPKPNKMRLEQTRMIIGDLQVMESHTIYRLEELLKIVQDGNAKPASFERYPGIWRFPQTQGIIFAILHGHSLPNLTAMLTDELHLEWVDGLQRETDIINFLLNKTKIHHPKDKLIHGKLFKQLPKQIQKQILQYPIVIKEFVLDSNDPDYKEKRKLIRDYYIKINSWSTPLNNAEKRVAIYEDSQFHKATIAQNRKMKKFYNYHNIMKGDMKKRSYDLELTGEFMVLVTEEAQSSGNKLSQFYEQWTKVYPKRKDAIAKLDHIVLRCIPKLLGKGNKLSDIGMDSFAHLYAIVGWCAFADRAGIEPPEDSFKRLQSFMLEVKRIGKMVDNAKSDSETETILNTNAGKYWKSVRDATRSKTNREKRIKSLGKAIMRT